MPSFAEEGHERAFLRPAVWEKLRRDWRMKTILVGDITLAVKKLCMEACVILGEDVLQALERAHASDESPVGREILARIIENAHIAKTENLPLCQDTGMAVLFLEIGQEVHFEGG